MTRIICPHFKTSPAAGEERTGGRSRKSGTGRKKQVTSGLTGALLRGSVANQSHGKKGRAMDLITTLSGSGMEGFLPAGWDLGKIDRLAALGPAAVAARESWWHPQFEPVPCRSFE